MAKIHVPEIQESNGDSEKNLGQYLAFVDFCIAISTNARYNNFRDTNHRELVRLFPALVRSRSFVSQQKLQTARAGFFTLTREEVRI